jgi:ubiquinone/menaquinone biosynthesis C-methylase UbiE
MKQIIDTNHWVDFWQSDPRVEEKIAEANIQFFLHAVQPFLTFRPSDKILDVGIGEGLLAYHLANRVKKIYCMDISKGQLERARIRLRGFHNIQFGVLNPVRYTDFSHLSGHRFDKVFFLSVIQYYKSMDEVSTVLDEVKKIVGKHGILVIADIPQGKTRFADLFSLVSFSLKMGIVTECIRHIMAFFFSRYRSVSANQPLLTPSEKDISLLLHKKNMEGIITNKRLTLNKNRLHVFVRF